MGTHDVRESLHWATRRVRNAGQFLDQLTGPPGDDPPPYDFSDVLKDLDILKEELAAFEAKLRARPEDS